MLSQASFVSLFCFLFSSSVAAQENEQGNQASSSNGFISGFSTQEARFGVGVVNETWSDSSLGQVYSNQKLVPQIGLSYRFHRNMTVDAEVGFAQATGNSDKSTFTIVPVTIGASAVFPVGTVEPFLGVGASFVQFSEVFETAPSYDVYGTKMGLDVRGGIRIGTRFIRKSQHPNAPSGPSQMDVQLLIGQRFNQTFGFGDGINLDAFRVGVGLNFRI